MKYQYEALGIPSSGYEYMRMTSQDLKEGIERYLLEFSKITNILNEVADNNTIPEFQGKSKHIQFINYGDTELVYVLSVDKRKYTLLVGQPKTEFGTVKREYENLKYLGLNHSQNVVVPMYYIKNDTTQKELYITPYLYQARCIGVESTEWGMWIPEPEYHFQEFSIKERSIINSCMIALLVKFFDDKNNLGIGACRLTGGDFVLEKGFENEKITYENILKRMKLIAARELISMNLEEYIEKIKEEFSRKTYYKKENQKDPSILINNKARSPMSIEEIESGIVLGLQLREISKQIEK